VDTTVVDDRREPLKLPAFEAAVMFAATRALERWRDEALDGARLPAGRLMGPPRATVHGWAGRALACLRRAMA